MFSHCDLGKRLGLHFGEHCVSTAALYLLLSFMNFLSSSAVCTSRLGSQGVRRFWACELWQPVKRGGREGNSEWRREEVRGEGNGKRRIMKRNVRGGAPLVCQPCTACVCVWFVYVCVCFYMSVCESLNTLPWVSESDMRSCFSSQSQAALKLTLLLSLTLSLSDFSLIFSVFSWAPGAAAVTHQH